ncbi:hypothetical protein PanWU01x14_132230, partial [Parasponia andersonii]
VRKKTNRESFGGDGQWIHNNLLVRKNFLPFVPFY